MDLGDGIEFHGGWKFWKSEPRNIYHFAVLLDISPITLLLWELWADLRLSSIFYCADCTREKEGKWIWMASPNLETHFQQFLPICTLLWWTLTKCAILFLKVNYRWEPLQGVVPGPGCCASREWKGATWSRDHTTSGNSTLCRSPQLTCEGFRVEKKFWSILNHQASPLPFNNFLKRPYILSNAGNWSHVASRLQSHPPCS